MRDERPCTKAMGVWKQTRLYLVINNVCFTCNMSEKSISIWLVFSIRQTIYRQAATTWTVLRPWMKLFVMARLKYLCAASIWCSDNLRALPSCWIFLRPIQFDQGCRGKRNGVCFRKFDLKVKMYTILYWLFSRFLWAMSAERTWCSGSSWGRIMLYYYIVSTCVNAPLPLRVKNLKLHLTLVRSHKRALQNSCSSSRLGKCYFRYYGIFNNHLLDGLARNDTFYAKSATTRLCAMLTYPHLVQKLCPAAAS